MALPISFLRHHAELYLALRRSSRLNLLGNIIICLFYLADILETKEESIIEVDDICFGTEIRVNFTF